jgi:ribose-phosphate pyrophosphokinase
MKTGQITSMSFDADVKGKSIVIVDDIIDGGATFIGLAAELRARGAKKLTLCVTHGVFSKGHEAIANTFDAVYTTNSYHQDRVGMVEGVWYMEVI